MNPKDQAIRSLSDGEKLIEEAFTIAKETLFHLRVISCLKYTFSHYGITYFVNGEDDLEAERKETARQVQWWDKFRKERIAELNKAEKELEKKDKSLREKFAKLAELQRLGYAKVKAFDLPSRTKETTRFRDAKAYLIRRIETAKTLIFMSKGCFKAPRIVHFEDWRRLRDASDHLQKLEMEIGEEDYVLIRLSEEESQLLIDLPAYLERKGIKEKILAQVKTTRTKSEEEDHKKRLLILTAYESWHKKELEKDPSKKRLGPGDWRRAWDQKGTISKPAQDAFYQLKEQSDNKKTKAESDLAFLKRTLNTARKARKATQ